MGITGLWKIVEPTSTEIPLECLEGKKLAVDVSIWIYQAQTAYPSDQPYPHLRLLINRLCKLLFYKIRPVFVFDGTNVPSLKRQVLESRRIRKMKEDDIIGNSKKMNHLKQIAKGQLTDAELEKTVKAVISPSKKTVLNDVYKDLASSSFEPAISSEYQYQKDQIYIQGQSDSSSDDDDVVVIENKDEIPMKEDSPNEGNGWEDDDDIETDGKQSFYDSFSNAPFASSSEMNKTRAGTIPTRREEIDKLVEQRETMRNSRLHPTMIPPDSQDFSNFQMQRLLKRGRLNDQIQNLTKTSNGMPGADKINVVGPDGTQHILSYAFSDEIQVVRPENSRDIDCIYQPKEIRKVDLSLDIFGEQNDKKPTEETKPEKFNFEDVEMGRPKELEGYRSKSGMLEAIARKRIKQHYNTDIKNKSRKVEESSDDDEMIDVSDNEDIIKAVIESTKTKIDNEQDKNESAEIEIEEEQEIEWDPQRMDKPSTSEVTHNLNDDWVRLETNDDDDCTPELYKDLQEFLTNCGIPWLEAPGEAEAQCVELEKLGLVDGVISDDSDVWAFGVHHVYRHMFAKNRRVQRYGDKSTTNQNSQLFCLQREDYISIAMLSGGDYCAGLNKIGAIGALELVAEFVENRKNQLDDLGKIENRIMRLLGNAQEVFLSSPEEIKGIAKSRQAMILRRHVNEANEKDDIEAVCTNREAVRAYLYPTVDSSSEKFRWRKMNISLIRNILHQRLHWPEQGHNEEKNSLEAFERWNTFLSAGGTSQMRLDRFFAQPYDNSLVLTWSKKVSEAMKKISKKSKGEKLGEEDTEKEKPKPKKAKQSPTKKPTAAEPSEPDIEITSSKVGKPARGRGRGRGRGRATRKSTISTRPTELVLSEESSEDSF